MRVKKAKLVRKYLRFYKLVFGINPVYNVLLDGNFVFAALKYKIDIADRIKALLQENEIKLYALRSSYDELNKAGEKTRSSMEYMKSVCTMLDDSSCTGCNAAEKLISFIEKNNRASKDRHYVVATQDQDLRHALGRIPGIPTLYLSKVVLVMEAPSNSSKSHGQLEEGTKTELSEAEQRALAVVRRKVKPARIPATGSSADLDKQVLDRSVQSSLAAVGDSSAAPVVVGERRKRKAKEANPLSQMQAEKDSNRSKKAKIAKYKRT